MLLSESIHVLYAQNDLLSTFNVAPAKALTAVIKQLAVIVLKLAHLLIQAVFVRDIHYLTPKVLRAG